MVRLITLRSLHYPFSCLTREGFQLFSQRDTRDAIFKTAYYYADSTENDNKEGIRRLVSSEQATYCMQFETYRASVGEHLASSVPNVVCRR